MVQSKKNSNMGYYAYAMGFDYNSAGALNKMRLGNGHWETYSYNERLQITQIGLGTTDTVQDILRLEYGYNTTGNHDNNGAMLSQKITVPTVGSNTGFVANQTYGYDSLNRLESAAETVSSTQTWKQTFAYDRFGNRRFNTTGSNTTTLNPTLPSKVTNPWINTSDNRFQKDQDSDTVTDYDYDKNGNLTLDAENKRFVYDAEGRQKAFFIPLNSGTTPDVTYYYDGRGQRVKKISSTEITIFVYDGGGQLAAEYSTALASTPQVSYLTTDHLGSPRIITNEAGAVTKRQDYTAFGEETVTGQRMSGLKYTTPDELRQGYTGYQKDDESGLDYAQARYYNSAHGRFTSVDPLTASAAIRDPQTFNRYSYALNSPYKFTDPLGLLADSPARGEPAWNQELEDFLDRMTLGDASSSGENSIIAQTSGGLHGSSSRDSRFQTQTASDATGNSGEATVDNLTPGDEDVGIEVIIWDGALMSWGGQFGHVSYIIDGQSYSWEIFKDKSGNEVWRIQKDDEYTNERRQASAGRGYVLDFGSPEANKRFKEYLTSAYDGEGGYSLTKNNCGDAFRRAINRLGAVEKFFGFIKDDEMRPSKHEAYIKDNLGGFHHFVTRVKQYPYDSSGSSKNKK